MAFKNYDDFPPPKPVKIPIGEKTYEFPGTISARAWLLIQKLNTRRAQLIMAELRGEAIDPEEEVLSDMEYVDVRAEVFGGIETELVADGVTSDCMQRLFMTLVGYHSGGQEAAEKLWNLGEPKAPNRAQRRKKPTSPRSRGCQGGSNARPARPGAASSRSGTSSRPTSKSTTT